MLPQVNTILYACDLDGKTQSALGLVFNLALANKAKVIIMHAMEPLSTQASNMVSSYIPEESIKAMREEAIKSVEDRMEKELSTFMDDNKEALAGLAFPPETMIVNGIPSEAIEKTAEIKSADMIVMNSRTHSRLGQMIIGSTANKVIHHSRIPVLVVPIK